MLDSNLQNVMQQYNAILLNYGRESAQLVSNLQDGKQDSVDGKISMKFEAF